MITETISQHINISSLICHRDMPLALTCLSSLLKYSAKPVHFILHDDGSLQEEDIALLMKVLYSPTIIGKREADEQMADALSKYPAALQFRQNDVLAKKLLDCVHFNDSAVFAYCDTDILFVRPFQELFAFPSSDINALMMFDLTNSYCMRSWQMVKYPLLQVPHNPNSGLLYYRRACYDMDFIEWFLSKQELRGISYFTEQTAWALLCWRASCRLWDPKQIAFMKPGFVPSGEFVAGHFVKTYRNLFDDYVNKDFPITDEPISIGTVPAKRCTAMSYAGCEVTRRLSRIAQGQRQ